MEQRIYYETNGLWYEHHGDYYFPLLGVPAEHPTGDCPISKYARMRLRYLKEHAPFTLSTLTQNGTLHDHLASIAYTCKHSRCRCIFVSKGHSVSKN